MLNYFQSLRAELQDCPLKFWGLQNQEIRKLLRKHSKGKTVKTREFKSRCGTSKLPKSGSFCRSEQKPDILNQVFGEPNGSGSVRGNARDDRVGRPHRYGPCSNRLMNRCIPGNTSHGRGGRFPWFPTHSRGVPGRTDERKAGNRSVSPGYPFPDQC